jgi:hypothetical protein
MSSLRLINLIMDRGDETVTASQLNLKNDYCRIQNKTCSQYFNLNYLSSQNNVNEPLSVKYESRNQEIQRLVVNSTISRSSNIEQLK